MFPFMSSRIHGLALMMFQILVHLGSLGFYPHTSELSIVKSGFCPIQFMELTDALSLTLDLFAGTQNVDH